MDIPVHIAIIMDGNGRWAQQRNLPRIKGHQEGIKTVDKIVKSCIKLGVKILTLYVFSLENWKRPKQEIDILMSLFVQYLNKKADELMQDDIRLFPIGDIKGLPQPVQIKLQDVCKRTSKNSSLTLILAINYGGRNEIVNATKKIINEVNSGNLSLEKIDERDFSNFLYTAPFQDPDLLIRTGGEFRISNFLLWQISYSEIYISDKFWPDFSENDFKLAIQDYNKRERRFGGIKN